MWVQGLAAGNGLMGTCATELLDAWRAASRNGFRPRFLIKIILLSGKISRISAQ